MVLDIVLKSRLFGITLATMWLSRDAPEMIIADNGSRGPWFPVQEFLLHKRSWEMIEANYTFTLDCLASHKNAVCKRFFSLAYEPEAEAQDFFQQRISRREFCWYFPPHNISRQDSDICSTARVEAWECSFCGRLLYGGDTSQDAWQSSG